ncbi:hypothetical protein D3C71_782230 [compost metagenome]
MPTQPEAFLRKNEAHVGIVGHEAKPIVRVARIQRDVGASRFQDAQQCNHHLQRSLHGHTDQGIGGDPVGNQGMCELVGTCIQLRIGKVLIGVRHSNGVWRARHLRLKQPVDAGVGEWMSGVVPLREQLAVAIRQDRKLRHVSARIAQYALYQQEVALPEAGHRLFPEQCGLVSPDRSHASRRFGDIHRQIKLGDPRLREQWREAEPRQHEFGLSYALEIEHQLEDGVIAQAACWLDFFNQEFKGRVLAGKYVEDRRLVSAQQFIE